MDKGGRSLLRGSELVLWKAGSRSLRGRASASLGLLFSHKGLVVLAAGGVKEAQAGHSWPPHSLLGIAATVEDGARWQHPRVPPVGLLMESTVC